MAIKAPCRNCKRELTICADGLCFLCRTASKGKEGAEKETALAAVRARVDAGDVQKSGKSGRRSRKPLPHSPAVTELLAEAAALRKQYDLPPVAPAPEDDDFDDDAPEGICIEGVAAMSSEPQTVIPVTLRLTVEIAVRVSGIV
ncbi:MAG TPA: hypothetical protein VLL97_07000 [Acidobacteriota bacterium]|nr:hypothetical protein [Acidobacteriota bacterium]